MSPRAASSLPHDARLLQVLRLAAALCGGVLLLVLASMAIESLEALRHVRPGRLVGDPGWFPTAGAFNLLPMVVASVLVTAGAVGLAAPLGVAAALFSRHLAGPRLGPWFRGMLEVMAGIPSVVYGLWGLTVVVPWIARIHPPGASLLAGVLVLGLMILPGVALASDAALGAVDPELRVAAEALGIPPWTCILRIELPSARGGIRTAVLQQLGRAAGETMVVLMVCGNVPRFPEGPFSPVRTLTATIALEIGYAMGDHRSALFLAGSLLVALVVLQVGWIHGSGEGPEDA